MQLARLFHPCVMEFYSMNTTFRVLIVIGKTDGAITRDAPVEKGGRLGYFEKWVGS